LPLLAPSSYPAPLTHTLASVQDLKREKPWDKLRMAHRQYETAKPWKRAGARPFRGITCQHHD